MKMSNTNNENNTLKKAKKARFGRGSGPWFIKKNKIRRKLSLLACFYAAYVVK